MTSFHPDILIWSVACPTMLTHKHSLQYSTWSINIADKPTQFTPLPFILSHPFPNRFQFTSTCRQPAQPSRTLTTPSEKSMETLGWSHKLLFSLIRRHQPPRLSPIKHAGAMVVEDISLSPLHRSLFRNLSPLRKTRPSSGLSTQSTTRPRFGKQAKLSSKGMESTTRIRPESMLRCSISKINSPRGLTFRMSIFSHRVAGSWPDP